MFDQEKALMSARLIKAAQGDVTVLTDDERQNLVAMIDDFAEANGWAFQELEVSESTNLN